MKSALIETFKQMPWEVWLHRHFSPFVTYCMMTHATSSAFREQGLVGQFPFALYDTNDWYSTPEMFRVAGEEAGKYFRQKDIFTLTRQCEVILEKGRAGIGALYYENDTPRVLFEKALSYIQPANLYVWIAHAGEAYYYPLLRDALRDYIPSNDLETFIGDISFPTKKNALALMEEEIRAGISLDEIYKKYKWMKARGGFHPDYSLDEMKEIYEKISRAEKVEPPHVEIPSDLIQLVRDVQELVYLRTLRTDALYEMYSLAMPIFNRFAESIGVDSLQHYIPDELLTGEYTRVPHEYAILKKDNDVFVVRESIVSSRKVEATEVSGVVAQKGFARGKAKVVLSAADISKVEEGDILVTNMTTPSYIAAMHKAAAFVTDEGGITCHAAIIAREMKKPCVIGTKIAASVFADGDVVDVDAEKGIVKKCV